ncbi:hypothetical protein H0W80_00280 [Candidatus Saccharibacteria bacterium]|nr:hypothetical protein [Candidatus Saccharibacteria bacterium]
MNNDNIQKAYEDRKQAELAKQDKARLSDLHKDKLVGNDRVQNAVIKSAMAIIEAHSIHEPKVAVKNLGKLAKNKSLLDINEAISSSEKTSKQNTKQLINSVNKLIEVVDAIPKENPELPDPVEVVKINNLKDIEPALNKITAAVNKLKLSPVFDPKITVSPANVNVTEEKVDVKPIVDSIEKLKPLLKDIKNSSTKVEFTDLINSVNATTEAISSLSFPVPNYILPFTYNGKATQAAVDSTGAIISGGDTTLQNLTDQLAHLINKLSFLSGVQGVAADIRVTMLSGTITTVTTVSTVTTVGTVTNQTNIGGYAATNTIMNQMNTNANQLRQQIITN